MTWQASNACYIVNTRSRPRRQPRTAEHNEGVIFAMQLPSYRRLLLASATVVLFALPASASAQSYSPPVLGGTTPSVTRSTAPSAPLGGNSPDALGYTEPTPAQPPVIYPFGTVMVSDGMGGVMPAFDRP